MKSLQKLVTTLHPIFQFLQKHVRFIFFIVLLLACSFLLFQINRFANLAPTDDEVTEKLTTVKRPQIDKDSVDKLEALQDQNIQVQSLFQQARNNPFSE